jgi:hypothetical protein
MLLPRIHEYFSKPFPIQIKDSERLVLKLLNVWRFNNVARCSATNTQMFENHFLIRENTPEGLNIKFVNSWQS